MRVTLRVRRCQWLMVRERHQLACARKPQFEAAKTQRSMVRGLPKEFEEIEAWGARPAEPGLDNLLNFC